MSQSINRERTHLGVHHHEGVLRPVLWGGRGEEEGVMKGLVRLCLRGKRGGGRAASSMK
jgi:hypothetical protein